jgi:hypothetical protein
MSRKIVIIILALVSVAMLINYLVIKPKSIDFVDGQLKEEFNGYITYKNNQKGFYLYLVNDPVTVHRLHLDTLYESEAFNKPQLGGDIKHIIFTDSILYRASHIGDKIEKLPNSNKCLLSTKEGTFRFNCYIISRDKREKISKIDEWQPNEIGLVKR